MGGGSMTEKGFPRFGVGQKVKILDPSPFRGREGTIKEARWTKREFMYKVCLESGRMHPFYEIDLENMIS